MTKSQTRKLIQRLDGRMKAVAKERDRIDALISEYDTLRENCDVAWEHLQNARDELSQLV